MKALWIVSALMASVVSNAHAAKLGLDFLLRVSAERLTAEKVIDLDPQVTNPHRISWFLDRKLRLDLASLRVESTNLILLSDPNGTCAAQEQLVAKEASESWRSGLTQALSSLEGQLARAADAQAREAIFNAWQERLDRNFRKNVEPKARARVKCRAPVAIAAPAAAPKKELLARAPMKFWHGRPTVRLNVTIGSLKLNGQFMIHTGAVQSVFSPSWLDYQGIPPDWLTKPLDAPARLPWSASFNPEGLLAYEGHADRVEIAGLELRLRDFRILDSVFASPPEAPGNCCDGVLGSDFFRQHVVEFRNHAPYEMLVWKNDGFSAGEKAPLIPIELNEQMQPISPCELRSLSKGGEKAQVLVRGARWNTAQSSAVELHRPNQGLAPMLKKGWRLVCGELTLAESQSAQHISVSRLPSWASGSREVVEASQSPGFSVGQKLLSRGNVIWDLPHGRLWFYPEGLQHPISENRTGLSLAYQTVDNERVLRVTGISKGSVAARVLEARGLRKGALIGRLDEIGIEKLDSSEVEARLAGREGAHVILEWKPPRSSYKVPWMRVELPTR